MNSSLHIGRTALLSYQSALQTVGNNISSAGSPDYTRLSPNLDPMQGPVITGQLQPGAGVALTGIQRNIDDALEGRIRDAIGATESGLAQQTSLTRIESFLDDINGTGVETQLRQFFGSFDQLQNTPEDAATRDLTLAAGRALAGSLTSLRAEFSHLGVDLDGEIADLVDNADDIARKIARLNEEIVAAEAGRNGQATGLRDQRDALLRDLAEIFDVTVREQVDGAVNVYIGSEALVQGAYVRGLTTVEDIDEAGFVRTSVEFSDSRGQVNIRGGRLHGLIVGRDQYAYGQIAMVDELAAAIISDVNRVHADGQGIADFRSVTASFDLAATDVSLADEAAGLSGAVTSGSFYLTVIDDFTGTPVAHRIDVDFETPGEETTLESLVERINTDVGGVTASIAPGNRLRLVADDGFAFNFGHDGQVGRVDTSGLLAGLGINTFFDGSDAHDIRVNATLQAQPLLLAAATSDHDGDGTNAGRLASLETTASDFLGGASIRETYNSLVSSVAIATSAASDDMEAATAVRSSLQAQRESISGVNLDEEAISLLKYERAFQGVSRFVSVVDGLIAELVQLIR